MVCGCGSFLLYDGGSGLRLNYVPGIKLKSVGTGCLSLAGTTMSRLEVFFSSDCL